MSNDTLEGRPDAAQAALRGLVATRVRTQPNRIPSFPIERDRNREQREGVGSQRTMPTSPPMRAPATSSSSACAAIALNRVRGWQRDAARLLVCGTLAAWAVSPVSAAPTDFASVVTAAGLTNIDPPPTACNSSLRRGLAFESSGPLSCNVGAATVSVSASAVAPSGTMPGQLAELHAATRIEVAPGGLPRPTYKVDALAFANFRDYVVLGAVRPDHMTFDFGLSGNLFISGPFDFEQSALVDMSIYAQSGIYASPGINSSIPFGEGASDAITKLVNNQPIQSGITDRAGNSPDFHFVETSPDNFELTLGTSFFDNPVNTRVLLEFGLLTEVLLRDYGPSSFDLLASSDYSHTLRMTDVRAFDAAGNDVTTDAFLGFESAGLAGVPAVPEPSECLLILLGLAWVVTKTSRSRHRSRP